MIMSLQNKISCTALIQKRCEELFFELGKLLALCKTLSEQQQLLAKILQLLETEKENSKPYESTLSDDVEIQKQLTRYYTKGFVRWGLDQKTLPITDEYVKQKGMLVAYCEETKRHEKYPIPCNLKKALNDGWLVQKTLKMG